MFLRLIKKFNFITILSSILVNVLLVIFYYDSDLFAYGFPYAVIKFNFVHNFTDSNYKPIFQMFFEPYQSISIFILNFLINLALIYIVLNILRIAYIRLTNKS